MPQAATASLTALGAAALGHTQESLIQLPAGTGRTFAITRPIRPASFPPSLAQVLGFGLAGSCQSALEVGGDFFDIVPLSNESLLMVVADVMGKGVPAALLADSLRTLIRAVAKTRARPSQWLTELNCLMFEQLSSLDMFITLQLVVADLPRRHLEIGNAGHCPLLVRDGLHRIRAVAPDGMPLGIQMEAGFEDEDVRLDSFASVLLYTDGLTEARNPEGRFFEQSRLERWFSSTAREYQIAAQIKDSLLQELNSFQAGEPAADDQTFLVLSDETPRVRPHPTQQVLELVA